jgi:transcriptional regulator with XRE-family HTH domain
VASRKNPTRRADAKPIADGRHWTALRGWAQLSQKEWSVRAQVSPSRISQYEDGQIVPDGRTQARLLASLKLPPSALDAAIAYVRQIDRLAESWRDEDEYGDTILESSEVREAGTGLEERRRRYREIAAEHGRSTERTVMMILEALDATRHS